MSFRIWLLVAALELAWIGEVLRRLSSDIREWRESETWSDKIPLLIVWMITAAIIYHVCSILIPFGAFLLNSVKHIRALS